VQAGVQHDDSEGEHVAGVCRGRGESAARQGGRGGGPGPALTCGLEDAGVALAVPLGEGLHHPVDLLRLPGQPEAPQELPAESEASRGSRTPAPSGPPPGHSPAPGPFAHRSACTRLRSVNSCSSTKACRTWMLNSSLREQSTRDA